MRWCRRVALVGLAAAAGCSSTEESAAPAPPPAIAPQALSLPSTARDSAATLDSLAAFMARVDADTGRMTVVRAPVDLGAGATGMLSAWRADTVWQRLHLTVGGEGFSTTETYWLHAGALTAARLETQRPDTTGSVERVWFRQGQLYRWVDPIGRHLSPEAQSTRTEVQMLRSRVDRILQSLPPADSAQKSPK